MATETRKYDLGINYGLKPENGSKKVKDLYPVVGSERTAFPWAWRTATGALLNLSADDFRELNIFTATMLDATFKHEADGNMDKGFLNTFNYVIIPPGKYWTNANIPSPRGGFEGASSFGYAGSGGDQGYYATEITMAMDYIGNPTEMYGLATPNFNLSQSGNFYAYNESYRAKNICFTNGNGYTTKQRIGFLLTMPGEVFGINNIRSNGFDIGIAIEGATPLTVGDVSTFDNRIAGVATRGGALSTASFRTISGDRNGSLFRQLPGLRGEPAGGSFNFGMGKGEDANIQGQGSYGSQVIAWCSGQFVVVVTNCRPTTENRINDTAFVVYPYIPSGNGGKNKQSSLLKATGQGHRYHTLLHDIGIEKRISHPGDYQAFDFSWASMDNSFTTSMPGDWKWEEAGNKVLGSVERDPMTGKAIGIFNYTNGTPLRNDDRDNGNYGGIKADGIIKEVVSKEVLEAKIASATSYAVSQVTMDLNERINKAVEDAIKNNGGPQTTTTTTTVKPTTTTTTVKPTTTTTTTTVKLSLFEAATQARNLLNDALK